MAQKDVGNKVPIYKLKTTREVMKYYDEWGKGKKYDKDMVDWNYTGPKETVEVFKKYALDKDITIFDAGCGSGLVGLELKKFGYKHFHGADLSQKLLDTIPRNLYQRLIKLDLIKFKEFFAPTILANFIRLDIFRGPVIPTCTGTLCLETKSIIGWGSNNHWVTI